MRVVSSGMMGVSPAFIEAAHHGLGAIVKRSYGSTEAPTVSTCTNDDPAERCRDTDGRAVGDAEIRIVDPHDAAAPAGGAEGEVWIRGPELFAGYADAAETAATMHRGWFRSGDLGVLDDQGWLIITGRIKELIIRGGENISSSEVERALELHPGIKQAVVVGRPDGGWASRWWPSSSGPATDRRRRVPALVHRARRGPVQDARSGRADRRGAAAGGGQARPGRAQGTGSRARAWHADADAPPDPTPVVERRGRWISH